MTIAEARKTLEHPIFGDPEHIKAVHFLEQVEQASALRSALKGKTTECWCCKGSGYIECQAGCDHECPTCEGNDELVLTEAILSQLTLGQLEDIAREQEIAA